MSTSGIPLSTYLSKDDVKALRALAAAADRSVAGEIRHAIRHHLSTSESPAGQPSSRDNVGVKAAGHVYAGE